MPRKKMEKTVVVNVLNYTPAGGNAAHAQRELGMFRVLLAEEIGEAAERAGIGRLSMEVKISVDTESLLRVCEFLDGRVPVPAVGVKAAVFYGRQEKLFVQIFGLKVASGSNRYEKIEEAIRAVCWERLKCQEVQVDMIATN